MARFHFTGGIFKQVADFPVFFTLGKSRRDVFIIFSICSGESFEAWSSWDILRRVAWAASGLTAFELLSQIFSKLLGLSCIFRGLSP